MWDRWQWQYMYILAIHGMSRTGSYLVGLVGVVSVYQGGPLWPHRASLQLYRSRRVSSHVPVNHRSRSPHRQSNISQNFIKIFLLSVDIYCPTIRNVQQWNIETFKYGAVWINHDNFLIIHILYSCSILYEYRRQTLSTFNFTTK